MLDRYVSFQLDVYIFSFYENKIIKPQLRVVPFTKIHIPAYVYEIQLFPFMLMYLEVSSVARSPYLKWSFCFRWDNDDAQVVCRQLGYSGGEARQEAAFGEGHGPIWLDSVLCYGDESQLDDCAHNPWGEHNCGHHEDAGVVCDVGKMVWTSRGTFCVQW